MFVVRTEVWNTRKGEVVKAVVRTASGRLVGATNQTTNISPTIIGKR
jgi:hypothetical protein